MVAQNIPKNKILSETYKLNSVKEQFNQFKDTMMQFSLLKHKILAHKDWVQFVTYSPDGSKIASAGHDNMINIWNAHTRVLEHALEGHQKFVAALSYCPQGKILASASEDQTIKIWDATTYTLITTLEGMKSSVLSVCISPDGSKLAAGFRENAEQTVKIWDLQTYKTDNSLQGYIDSIAAVAFSPDSTRLASASYDKTIKIQNLKSNTLETTLYGHKQWISSVKYHPDGTILASGSGDHTVIIWDLKTSSIIATLAGCQDAINSISFNPNGTKLAGACGDDTVKIWDLKTFQMEQVLEGHQWCVTSVCFSNNGQELATASQDQSIFLWDLNTDQDIYASKDLQDGILSVCINHQYTKIATGGEDNMIKIWDPINLTLESTLQGHQDHVNSVKFSPDDKKLASASRDITIIIWDVKSLTQEKTLKGHYDSIYQLLFNSDGSKLASCSIDKSIKIWDLKTGKEEVTLESHKWYVSCIAFSPDGLKIASGSIDKSIKIWDLKTYKVDVTIEGHQDGILCICFINDGKKLASGGRDMKLHIWDLSTNNLDSKLDGHQGEVNTLCISPDQSKLISGGSDGKIILWDLKTYSIEQILQQNTMGVNSVIFNLDGDQLISGGGGGQKSLIIWDIKKHYNKNFRYFNQFIELQKQQDLQHISYPDSFSQENKLLLFENRINIFNYLIIQEEFQVFSKLLEILEKSNIFVDLVEDDFSQMNCFELVKDKKNFCQSIFNYYANNQVFLDKIKSSKYYQKQFLKIIPILINHNIQGLDKFFNNLLDVCQLNDGGDKTSLQTRIFGSFKFIQKNDTSLQQTDIKDLILSTSQNKPVQNEEESDNNQQRPSLYERIHNKFSFGESLDQTTTNPEIQILKLCDATKSLFLLYQLRQLKSNHPLFNNDAVEFIIQSKWRTYGQWYFLLDLFFHVLILITFLANYVWIFPYKLFEDRFQTGSYVLIFINLALLFLKVLYEFYHYIQYHRVSQLKGHPIKYFDVWNIIDLIFILLNLVTLALDLRYSYIKDSYLIEVIQGFSSITILILGIRIISFCRGIQQSSFMIRLLSMVFQDIMSFSTIFCFFIIIFSFSTYVLQTPSADYQYGRIQNIQFFHRLVIGDVDQLKNLDWNTQNSFLNTFEYLIYVGATILLVIIMLNLLIAFISDSYEKIVALERQNFNYEITCLLFEIDVLLGQDKIDKLNKQYLFVSRCVQDSQDQDAIVEGQSRIRQVVEKINSEVRTMKIDIKGQKDSIKNVQDQIQKVQEDMSLIKNDMKDLKANLSYMIQLLEKK